MKITMVGTGYVGLVTGGCLATIGNTVVCLDIDEKKIDMLRSGQSPIYEPGLPDMIARNVAAGRLRFTTDKEEAYRDVEAIFICVDTPSDEDGSADLQHVMTVAEDIAAALDRRSDELDPPLVVVKSTVPVGSTHEVGELIRRRTTKRFHLANNPEFLKEGAAISDFMKPDRVVCGVDKEETGKRLETLFMPLVRQGNPVIILDIRSSEMVKYASNAMLACKISFINEIAQLCEHYGADIRGVWRGMTTDRRIGNQFLYPGLGYGGSCFPKDTLAVIGMGRSAGFECTLNVAVHQVNQQQRAYFWNKIDHHFGGNFSGVSLAFWGVSFKPETDDIREAPAISLMRNALAQGASIRAFDPVATENLKHEIPEVDCFGDMYEVLDGCDALVVCTEWGEFHFPEFEQIATRLKNRVIFDGRNIYSRRQMQDLGFTYHSVGRPPVNQSDPVKTE